jgi:hypothetical protein
MRAVWCSPHAFGAATQVSAHHLARRLAGRGWEVLFLSGPVSPLHMLGMLDGEMRRRLACAARGVIQETPKLRSLVPLTTLPFAGRLGASSAWMLAHWPHFTLPPLRRTIERHGFDTPDLHVIDGPVALPLLDVLRPKRSVLRILDRLGGFASATPALLDATRAAADLVNLVTFSASDLAGDMAALKPAWTIHIPNGVDFKAFSEPQPPPAAYAQIAKPRAVYAGALAEWFDFDLIAAAARQRPDISFVLIGPPLHARRRLPSLPNLHLLGVVPWQQVPAYLQHAQIGLIPFDVERHAALVHGINPLKLYEYCAAGLPVVSVAWRELQKLDAPIRLTQGHEDFIAALDAMLASPTPAATLQAFAARHDWEYLLDRLLEAAA